MVKSQNKIFSATIFIASISIVIINSNQGDICGIGLYYDNITDNCQHCSDCCPPRDQNQFCKKGCNLAEICTQRHVKESSSESSGPIIGGIVGAIVFFVLVVAVVLLICFLYKRRKNKSDQASNPIEETEPNPKSSLLLPGQSDESTTTSSSLQNNNQPAQSMTSDASEHSMNYRSLNNKPVCSDSYANCSSE